MKLTFFTFHQIMIIFAIFIYLINDVSSKMLQKQQQQGIINYKVKIKNSLQSEEYQINQNKRHLQTIEVIPLFPPINYILNGDFSINNCLSSYCIYKLQNYNYQVQHWHPQPQMQIGKPSFYQSNYPSNNIIELATNKPTCITQYLFNLPDGYYSVKVIYQARPGTYMRQNKFAIIFSQIQLQNIQPNNNSINTYERNIFVPNKMQLTAIKICGKGTSIVGALIYQVRLERIAKINIIYKQKSLIDRIKQWMLQLVTDFINSQIFKILSQLPTSRTLFKSFYALYSYLDHLWLYAYHHRQYNIVMNIFFYILRGIQTQKWNINSLIGDSNQFNNFINSLKTYFSMKNYYLSQQFYLYEHYENSFFTNAIIYFIINVPLTILVFFIGKILQKLLSKRVNIIFLRSFSINLYIFVLVLQGNYQIFSYYLTSDILSLFCFTKKMKMMNIGIILILFIFVFICFAGIFVAKWHYKKNIYISRLSNKFKKCIYFVIETSIFNLLLGATHSITYKNPSNQLIYLSCIQISYILFLLKFHCDKKNLFINRRTVWISIITSFLRILFNLINNNYQILSQQFKKKMMEITLILIFTYFIICFLIMMIQIFQLVRQLIFKKLKISIKNVCSYLQYKKIIQKSNPNNPNNPNDKIFKRISFINYFQKKKKKHILQHVQKNKINNKIEQQSQQIDNNTNISDNKMKYLINKIIKVKLKSKFQKHKQQKGKFLQKYSIFKQINQTGNI